MNERIRELANQAGFNPYDYEGANAALFKKFAELIVQECAGIFEGVYTDQQRPERIDTRIKLHFGVEP